jgi:hypothetical protein
MRHYVKRLINDSLTNSESLREQLHELSETYRTLSSLSKTYERNSRFWRTFTLIAVPAAALLSGGVTALVLTGR